jgi:hypothetical protein
MFALARTPGLWPGGLKQIVADPENCLVWNIVSNWYLGRSCVYCHKRFSVLRRFDHAPALMREDRTTIKWDQIRPDQLPEILSTAKPVCWNCHIAETFRRVHPELVIECKRKPAACSRALRLVIHRSINLLAA